jgi:hypothetical protein
MIGFIVKISKVIDIGTHGESIDMPWPDFAQDLKSIKALPDVWSFPNGYQTTGTVVQLLPSSSEGDPLLFTSGANIQERSFKVEPLLIVWSRAA